MHDTLVCPLCHAQHNELFYQGKDRPYFQCNACQLIFVPALHYLSIEAERAHYQTHQNNPEDLGYRAFLSRLSIPLCQRLSPHSSGLDFGSGPGPTLSVMLEEAGHQVAIYDPCYAADEVALGSQYQFITATEVVEHLHTPGKVFAQLCALLQPEGWLGIMTQMAPDKDQFGAWYYKNDPTHVCFFSRETFVYIARRFLLEVEFFEKGVILLKKRLIQNQTSLLCSN